MQYSKSESDDRLRPDSVPRTLKCRLRYAHGRGSYTSYITFLVLLAHPQRRSRVTQTEADVMVKTEVSRTSARYGGRHFILQPLALHSYRQKKRTELSGFSTSYDPVTIFFDILSFFATRTGNMETQKKRINCVNWRMRAWYIQ